MQLEVTNDAVLTEIAMMFHHQNFQRSLMLGGKEYGTSIVTSFADLRRFAGREELGLCNASSSEDRQS